MRSASPIGRYSRSIKRIKVPNVPDTGICSCAAISRASRSSVNTHARRCTATAKHDASPAPSDGERVSAKTIPFSERARIGSHDQSWRGSFPMLIPICNSCHTTSVVIASSPSTSCTRSGRPAKAKFDKTVMSAAQSCVGTRFVPRPHGRNFRSCFGFINWPKAQGNAKINEMFPEF